MRDPVLNEALKRLAAEAATRLSTLVASGDQIPFDVAERAGSDSLFHSYRPLTAEYVRQREAELVSLPFFEPARSAVLAADVAASYLDQHGEPVPAQPRERATRMLIFFLAGLWEGSTEFSLNPERLESALALLEAGVRDINEAEVLIAPLAGLQMRVPRLKLPHGVEIVRADAIEAPAEAVRSEGTARRPWDPQFLAVAEQGDSEMSAEEALRQLRELISVMRLFKRGGVGLGPYAFAPTGEGGWRRRATGAPAVRPGGYTLSEEEAEQLADLARALETRPDPGGSLAWAVNRFELGCGRRTALEGLSDHLLALRAVLEGKGPVGASLPVRAAALITDLPGGPQTTRERMEAALDLERSLMTGGPPAGTPELADWVEGSVRGILREAALGRLGADLGTAADSTLIATGLEAGDIESAVSVETPPGMPGPAASPSEGAPSAGAEDPADQVELPSDQEEHMDDETRIMEPIPAEDEIRITATNWLEEVEVEAGA
ncbi:MAG TPA: hypothetical protein VFZ41_08230, partial [Solirubrobacterales bacterium]